MKTRKPQFTLYVYNKESQDSTQNQDQPSDQSGMAGLSQK